MLALILLLAALIVFLLEAFAVVSTRVDLTALGLALLTGAILAGGASLT
jgi:hypothetical protein